MSDLFVVQHLGLRPQPKPFTCPNYGIHPVPLLPLHGTGSYADAGSGCPNKWVLRAGADGQITGFQTVATVTTGPALESSLQSMWDNSDAATLELYEHTIWKVENNNGGVLNTGAYSTGRTIGQWRDELDTRRPQPLVHRHRFSYEPGATLVCLDSSVAGPGTTVVRPCNVHNYIHGSKCAGNDQATGTIIVLPRP